MGAPLPPLSASPWIDPLSRRQAALIAFGLALCMLIIGWLLPAVRVGDGSEYYGLYLALKNVHRPFMTEAAFQAYDQLVNSRHVADLPGTEAMRHAFPSLIQAKSADFNHFWFYPALALLAGGWLDTLGAGPHAAFLCLHALLFAALLFVAGRSYGRLGIIAAIVVTAGSPIVWFFDKVHTEFFTYCCVAIASIWFARRRYFAAAIVLAAASTQNISIGATAMFALALGGWQAGWLRRQFHWRDLLPAALAIALVGLHPLYYFFRVGVIDPQLLAGGAKIGTNLGSIFIWLVDPDVGLLPNWPFSLVIIALGLVAMRKFGRPSWQTCAYVVVFVVTNLYAQASTQNLNSGATIYVARYATWYIGLFVPLLAFGLAALRDWAKWALAVAAMLVGAATVANAMAFEPTRHETYMEPTTVSKQLQLHLPHLYDPPPQIFSERFSGIEMSKRSLAAFGPDCAKVVVIERPGVPVVPRSSPPCNYDLSALPDRVLHPKEWQGTLADGRHYAYLHLTADERKAAHPALRVGTRYKPTLSDLQSLPFLGEGWYGREDLGVWTKGDHAQMQGNLPVCPASGLRVFLTLTPHLTPKNPMMALSANANGRELGKRELHAQGGTVSFDIPCEALRDDQLNIDLHVEGWMSPLDAGESSDWRQLGVFLREFWFEPQG